MNKLVYLISPNEISNNFYYSLNKVLSYGNVKFFQLRLKKEKKRDYRNRKKIRKITSRYNVKLIINDDYNLVSKIRADGCHLGQLDGSIKIAKKKLKNKILGVTCHNSITLAKMAIKDNADYVAFGSFFKSNLKPNAKKANLSILKIAKKKVRRPIVGIGGINNLNYKD